MHTISSCSTPADRWIDNNAETIGRLAAELRSAAAALEHGGQVGRARTSGGEGMRTITIGLAEARALLRAIEPHQLTLGGRGSRTSRLVTSLAEWWHRWVRLSLTPAVLELPAAIEAGLQLRLDLGDWLETMRWHQATTRARVSWPQPARDRAHITAVPRQSIDADRNKPAPPRRRRGAVNAPGQRTLLLPIGGSGQAAASPEAAATPLISGQQGAAA